MSTLLTPCLVSYGQAVSQVDKVVELIRGALKDPENQKKLGAAFAAAAAKLAKSRLSRRQQGARAACACGGTRAPDQWGSAVVQDHHRQRASHRRLGRGEPVPGVSPYEGDLAEALRLVDRAQLREPPSKRPKIWQSDWWAPPGKYRVTDAGWWPPPEGHRIWQLEWWRKDRQGEETQAPHGLP